MVAVPVDLDGCVSVLVGVVAGVQDELDGRPDAVCVVTVAVGRGSLRLDFDDLPASPTPRRRRGLPGACRPWGSTCRRRRRRTGGGLSPRCPGPAARASPPRSRAGGAGCACPGSGGAARGPHPRPAPAGGSCPSRTRTRRFWCRVGRRRVTPCYRSTFPSAPLRTERATFAASGSPVSVQLVVSWDVCLWHRPRGERPSGYE